MKAIVRFYDIKTGELLRSKQMKVFLDQNGPVTRTIFDPPITCLPNEEFRVEVIFENPILRAGYPSKPKTPLFLDALTETGNYPLMDAIRNYKPSKETMDAFYQQVNGGS